MKKTNAQENTQIDRRGFLKTIPMVGGAVICSSGLASCSSQSQGVPPTQAGGSNPEAVSTAAPLETEVAAATATIEPEFLPQIDGSFESVELPEPQKTGGMPLMEALALRQSTYIFKEDELPLHILSNLLWAGFGINRGDGKRTAPSALNFQDVTIYLATAKGVFQYDARSHSLKTVMANDIRPRVAANNQVWVPDVPAILLYASDHSRMKKEGVEFTDEQRMQWSWAHSGLIAQNVYLYCAAEGLASRVISTINREPLKKELELPEEKHIILAHCLGYA